MPNRFVPNRGVWVSGDVFTNPSDGQVLVDTGALEAGDYLVATAGAGSVAWVYDVQQRNAANDGNINAQRRRPAAGNEDYPFPNKVFVNEGERLRCVLSGTISGQVQMSVYRQSIQG